ncbi:MAG TPA: CAP domain-containing protein [Candidatus Saccharimonadales bacterium]|nr:CAP domain-containing protein [Candidatus Saccharimonadales bacterium]
MFLTYICLGNFAVSAFADSTGFLSLINSYRAQNGLGTLVEDQSLTNSACWFAGDMAAKNYFPSDHVDSQGRGMSQRLADFGVATGSRAENIYYTTASSAASVAFNAWKNSSGHNANMLGPYTRIGIGRVNGSGKWYWVTDFANGSASTLTNQCGASIAPPPPPPPPAVKKKITPPPPPPAVTITDTPVPVVETPVATPAATVSAYIATNLATKSAVVIKVAEPEEKAPVTLVQGIAATSLILGNFALFGFIVWRLYRHRHFLR